MALQTFYRLFAGKDQLLLAVFEDLIAESCARYEEAARDLPDPVARLRFYISAAVGDIGEANAGVGPQFVTAEHWRLYQLFPEEMTHATQPFTDLVARQARTGRGRGAVGARRPATRRVVRQPSW